MRSARRKRDRPVVHVPCCPRRVLGRRERKGRGVGRTREGTMVGVVAACSSGRRPSMQILHRALRRMAGLVSRVRFPGFWRALATWNGVGGFCGVLSSLLGGGGGGGSWGGCPPPGARSREHESTTARKRGKFSMAHCHSRLRGRVASSAPSLFFQREVVRREPFCSYAQHGEATQHSRGSTKPEYARAN